MGALSMMNIRECWDLYGVPAGERAEMLEKIQIYLAAKAEAKKSDGK